MAQTEIRVKAKALPGKRIDVTIPELDDGEEVELIVLRHSDSALPVRGGQIGIWDYIQSLPAGPRSASTWDEIERSFQAERDAWDR